MNPDRDETVLRLTEGRVPCINHEITDYFRTKPDPEVAATEQKMEEEAKSAYSGTFSADKVECIFITSKIFVCNFFPTDFLTFLTLCDL